MDTVAIIIEPNDIEDVLEALAEDREAPILNCYFTAAAYPKQTPSERDTALFVMRGAWVDALERRGVPRMRAWAYLMRQEGYVRRAMNEVDGLPVRYGAAFSGEGST